MKLKICNTARMRYTIGLMRHCLWRRAEYFNVKISELLQKNCFSTFVHALLVTSVMTGLLLLIMPSHRRSNYRAQKAPIQFN